MHACGVAHRDIKPENVVIDASTLLRGPLRGGLNLKLIDFGLAAPAARGTVLRGRVGTPYYVAPEVVGRGYTLLCDEHSVGVVAYVLLCAKPPFNGRDDAEVLGLVQAFGRRQKARLRSEEHGRGAHDNSRAQCFDDARFRAASGPARALVCALMAAEPARPAAGEALQAEWFQGARAPPARAQPSPEPSAAEHERDPTCHALQPVAQPHNNEPRCIANTNSLAARVKRRLSINPHACATRCACAVARASAAPRSARNLAQGAKSHPGLCKPQKLATACNSTNPLGCGGYSPRTWGRVTSFVSPRRRARCTL